MLRVSASLLCLVLCLRAGSATGQTNEVLESPAARDARMAWFRDAKFGMFIHWGVYAVPAGTWQGKPVPGIGEWIMKRGTIPVADYRAFAKEFNPVKYDPAAWAAAAKDAGMKYVVITAKHHDGFALFPSEASDWDVADATPYRKDLIGPLAKAVRAEGLKFGTYYSQAQDWTHPGGAKSGLKEGEGWDEAHKGSYDEYLAKIAVPQVRELLTQVQPDVLWWDTPTWMTAARAKPLHDLLALKPGIIANNRLGGGYKGDTETPEQHIPATGFKGRDWETCMTMNDTWGYKSYDQNWKSTETLVRNLIDIVSKGGNYLLNVGPTAQGEIPAPSLERLREIGVWMKANGESIYGTTASPFRRLTWGRCTKKTDATGGVLYFHVFDWPADGKLVVPGLSSKVTAARLLVGGAAVPFQAGPDGLVLTVPATAPDPVATVVAVTFTGPLEVNQPLPAAGSDGAIALSADLADAHNVLGSEVLVSGPASGKRVTGWTDSRAWVSWDFAAAKAGAHRVSADVSGPGGGKLRVVCGKSSNVVDLAASPDGARRTLDLGVIEVKSAGEARLELRPEKEGWKGVDVFGVRLVPGTGQ